MKEAAMRRLFIAIGVCALLSTTAGGCASQPETLCNLVCECEHCNDYAEEATCASRERELAVAEAYGCEGEWEAYATCFEENGTCDEQKVRFSTEAPGQCSGLLDSQLPCVLADECQALGGDTVWSCIGGMCSGKSCAGGNNSPCRQDNDCDGGEDRCGLQASNLNECQTAASAHLGNNSPF